MRNTKETWHANGKDGYVDGQVYMDGKVFADGHATRTGVEELDRASWAVIELDNDGNLKSWVRGVVPA